MPFQVDVWAGDLHQKHIDVREFDEFSPAAIFMEEQVEIGHLCNVLHTDFIAPAHRVDEQSAALFKYVQDGGT